MKPKLILGLDIGTSGVRAAFYDVRGDLLPETLTRNAWSSDTGNQEASEFDAEIALKQVIKTIDEVLRNPAVRDGEIEYVASCAFWHSLVGVDRNGKPTTKVLSWSYTRGGEYAAVLKKRFDEGEIHDRTGAHFHSSYWPAKLLCIRREDPQAFARTSLWLSFSDLVALRLFGVAATSVSMASGTGIFNIRTCVWDAQMLRFVGIKSGNLPLVADGTYTFPLVDKYRKRWPRLRSAAWFPAIGDGAANNIGSGCTKRSQAALMIGTSGAMRVAFEDDPPAEVPGGLWCYRIDRRRVIIGGALSDGGNLYALLKQKLGIDIPDDQIGKEIARRGAGAHGLAVLPFFHGERSTGYNEGAAGSIIGLNPAHDAIDILQAAMEAVAYRFAEIFDRIRKIAPVRKIFASGGAIEASPVWTQIIADVLGKDLDVFRSEEASMRGTVLLALETTGRIKKIEDAPAPASTIFASDRSRKVFYETARRRQQKLYKLVIDQ